MNVHDISLFHITHARNLTGMIQSGRLWSDQQRIDQGFAHVNIGYSDIKERRRSRHVPLPDGGFVGQYVPFYFAPRSPILFTIHKGKVTGYSDGQTGIVYLRSTIGKALESNRPYCFTDGHAEMGVTRFSRDLDQLESLIDWTLLKAKYWNDTVEDSDRKRRRQAEFLVFDYFPWGSLIEIGAMNEDAAEEARNILEGVADPPRLVERRDWYY
ncbi:MAG: DUF4433 domain-containing protein [Magnetococcales bacterium]|nr:DUF4433 domain-containing protein [Magnetococcales bacterium]